MTGQWWMAAGAAVLVVSSLLLARLDAACQAKADSDFARWADDAIDLTGGQR